jgi:hypothetical protein
MKGAKVEDWAEQQQEYMNDRKSTGRIAEFESHWRDFEKSFKDTFMDIAKHVKAENDLKTLKMTGGDIDSYIATFTRLIKMAGYKENGHGALNLFKRGLPDGLNVQIINNYDPVPDTLKGWQESARQQQLKYLQTQEFLGKKKANLYAAALAKKLGARTHQNHRDPNAMDINTGRFTPLSNKEKQKLRDTSGCFRCQKKGHIAKYCPTKQDRNAEYGRPAPTQNACSGITEVPEPKNLESILADVKAYLSVEENKQKFYDGLMESDFA